MGTLACLGLVHRYTGILFFGKYSFCCLFACPVTSECAPLSSLYDFRLCTVSMLFTPFTFQGNKAACHPVRVVHFGSAHGI